jgi:glycosyltransferase involved in cell wall biosynthesis
VQFLGTLTGNSYNNILSIMDLYVQPSLYEGLPRTLLDAMAAERAIVATNVNGNREAIEDEVNGVLVIPESSEDIHRAIRRLIDNPTFCEQIAGRARECVIANFGMARQLAKIENIVLSD